MKIRLFQVSNSTMERLVNVEGNSIPVGLFLGVYEPTIIDIFTLYECTWEGDLGTTNPEEVYEILNCNHPADYRTRSMSCGDILVTAHGVYIVAMMGFKKLNLEIK